MYRITEAAARAAEDLAIMACANTFRSYATSGPTAHEDARRLLAEARECLPETGETLLVPGCWAARPRKPPR
jgi:hypothetical protein